jgi:hypothetical protein
MNDLINLMEWNQFAEDRKTLLEALTILNNRHREAVGKLESEIAAMREAIRVAYKGLLTADDDGDYSDHGPNDVTKALAKLQPFIQ